MIKRILMYVMMCLSFSAYCIEGWEQNIIDIYKQGDNAKYIKTTISYINEKKPSLNLNKDYFGDGEDAVVLISILSGSDAILSYVISSSKFNLHDSEAQVKYIGDTFLDVALEYDGLQIIKTLVDRGADINYEVEKMGNSIMSAIRSKNIEKRNIINYLLSKKVNLHTSFINDDGVDFDPLSLSMVLYPEIGLDILKKYTKLDLNKKNNLGMTPIFYAALYNREDAVRAMLAKKVDVNVVSINDLTPIYFAASNAGVSVMQMLLDSGADINRVSAKNETVFMAAASSKNSERLRVLDFVYQNANKEILSLRFKGDKNTVSAMFFAASNDNFDIVKKMIEEYKLSFDNISDVQKNPMLVFALYAKENKTDKIQYFLDKGISVNAIDANGNNMLMYVLYSYTNNTNIINDVKFLLNKGINYKITTKNGDTPKSVLNDYLDQYKDMQLKYKNANMEVPAAAVDKEIKNLEQVLAYIENFKGVTKV